VCPPSLARRLGREVVRERGGVRYLELRARNLVNRCNSPRVRLEVMRRLVAAGLRVSHSLAPILPGPVPDGPSSPNPAPPSCVIT
jgi:hypothetical protein